MQQLVEDHWKEWCAVVNVAPWLNYWKKSEAIKKETRTPKDDSMGRWSCGNVPLTIYTAAVWGFGVDDWFHTRGGYSKALGERSRRGAPGVAKGVHANEPLSALLKLQQVKIVYSERRYTWDPHFEEISMPYEFGELDRWLEKLWLQVLVEEAREVANGNCKS